MPGREEGTAGTQPHLHSVGPTLVSRCPGPNQDPALAYASCGSTYFVTGALGFVVAASRLSLAWWRNHRSPGAGAASPVSKLQHLPIQSRRDGFQRPET